MIKIRKYIIMMLLCLSLVGCQSTPSRPKYQYNEDYQLVYFYIKDCPNCKHFREDVLPIIKEEFGQHIKIKAWDMDDDKNNNEVKTVYDSYVNQIKNFNKEDDYGLGPFVVLEDYIAILGAGDGEDYVDNLSKLVRGKKMGQPASVETRYYFLSEKQ